MGFGETVGAVAGQRFAKSKLSPEAQSILQLALLLSVSAVFLFFGLHEMTDSKYSMLVSENLLKHQSFVIPEISIERPEALFHLGVNEAVTYPYQLQLSHGMLMYWYPIGSSVLSVPFVALMNAAGMSALSADDRYDEDGDQKIQAAVAALLMAGLTVIFFRTAMLLLPVSWSLVMALGAAFSTQIWSTASRVLWSHTWQIFLLGIAGYMLLSAEVLEERGHPIVLATLLSWAYFVRPTSSIPIMAISIYLLIHRPYEFRRLAIVGALWEAAFVVFSWRVFQQPVPSYYLFARNYDAFWEAIAGDLLSPSRGLFVYVPASACALFLIAYYWRVLTHRGLVVMSLATISIHLPAIATDQYWWAGHCYGARLTTDIVPWFFLLGVIGARSLLDEARPRLKHYAMSLSLLTLIVGTFMNGRGAISSVANDWVNGPPDVDQASYRVWEWSDPQFLAGLHLPRHHESR